MSSQLDLGHAERVSLPTATGSIAGLATGALGAPPVLLIPGYTGSKEDFGPLLDGIAAAGYRAVAIDLPGQYESGGSGDPADYTPVRLAGVVRGVAKHLGVRVHLLGHSFGGLVARATVIAEPTRFASLVLMDSGPAALGGARAALITQLEPLLARAGVPAVYDASEAAYRQLPGYVEAEPNLAAFLRRRFVAGAPAMLTGMGRALREEPDRVAELAATGIPTLVVYGVDDDAWPPTVQDVMAQRLGAAVAGIENAVHSPAVENPEPTLQALLTFWRLHRTPNP
jgi:pimeloyl-ACP methyl ester carboxylesterase